MTQYKIIYIWNWEWNLYSIWSLGVTVVSSIYAQKAWERSFVNLSTPTTVHEPINAINSSPNCIQIGEKHIKQFQVLYTKELETWDRQYPTREFIMSQSWACWSDQDPSYGSHFISNQKACYFYVQNLDKPK